MILLCSYQRGILCSKITIAKQLDYHVAAVRSIAHIEVIRSNSKYSICKSQHNEIKASISAQKEGDAMNRNANISGEFDRMMHRPMQTKT